MAQGGIGNQSPATLFQARLDTSIPLSSGLKLLPYIGNKVVVSGVTVVIPGTGFLVLNTDNLIDATGADAGAAPAASTLYYVYVSNQKASFSPLSIRLSATPPQAPFVAGVKYLNVSGNALNWRFVGWVQLNTTPNFESSPTSRTIVNYYNRLMENLFISPGYTNTDGFVNFPLPAAWGGINGGTGDSFKWISNGEDAVAINASAMIEAGGAGVSAEIGVSIDAGDPEEIGFVNFLSPGIAWNIGVSHNDSSAEGTHTASLYAYSGAPAGIWFSDILRSGLTVTPFPTYMEAIVPV